MDNEQRIRRKIGQVVFCGFDSYEYNKELDELINKYYLGNIIYFTRNYKNPSQMIALNKTIYNKIIDKCGIIPLCAIDQEGGNVTRLMNGVSFPPSPLSSAKTNVENARYEVGKIIAYDMISLGFNLNLAPCLDINNEDSYYTNIRMYSKDPYEVAKMTKEFINGLSEYGVLACMKHFPGCGEGVKDTHFNKSIISRDINQLRNHELIPFIENINTACLMTSHSVYDKIDDKPATLSNIILQDILRKEMGYQGIVITDALEMKAISDYYGAVESSLLALNAGADMILCCHDRDIQVQTFEYLYNKVLDGSLKESDLDIKIERIKKYKLQLMPYLDKYFFNKDIYERNIDNDKICYEIVRNAYRIYKGDIPIITKDTLFIAPELYAINGAEDVFDERSLPQSLKKCFNNDVLILDDKEETKEYILSNLYKYKQVVAFSYNINISKTNLSIINEVNNHINTYIISMKGEMDIDQYDNLKNYIVMYEYTPNSIKAIIDLLKHKK